MTREFDIDSILKELGQFGKYQIINYIYLCIPIVLSAAYTLAYVFTAGNLQYRCKIPGCDLDNNQTKFEPNWLSFAVPYKKGVPENCIRFQLNAENQTSYNNFTADPLRFCYDSFDSNQITTCDEFVYETDENTIIKEFNLHCDENDWKIALIGTVNSIAVFVFILISGLLSDRYGRRTILIIGCFLCGVFGLLKSFSVNYVMFVVCEFFEAGVLSGTYATIFILGIELLGPKKRVFGGTLIACSYTIGEVLLGFVAMYIHDFRILIRVLYTPILFILAYFWLIPESVRWLMVNGKRDKVASIILKAAKTNDIILSDIAMQTLYDKNDNHVMRTSDEQIEFQKNNGKEKLIQTDSQVKKVLKSKVLLLRLANLSFCWMTNAFVYYGLSLNSVSLDGNKYVNFILISLAEIPGYIITYIVMDRLGRRWSLAGALFVCGCACLGSQFLPETVPGIRLVLFLFGKCAITVSFTVLYVYASEMLPTNLRNSLMSTCSMIGRFGSVAAPQTPLLARYMPTLPVILFGSTAILSAILALDFPETVNTKLPDTVEEAEVIESRKISN